MAAAAEPGSFASRPDPDVPHDPTDQGAAGTCLGFADRSGSHRSRMIPAGCAHTSAGWSSRRTPPDSVCPPPPSVAGDQGTCPVGGPDERIRKQCSKARRTPDRWRRRPESRGGTPPEPQPSTCPAARGNPDHGETVRPRPHLVRSRRHHPVILVENGGGQPDLDTAAVPRGTQVGGPGSGGLAVLGERQRRAPGVKYLPDQPHGSQPVDVTDHKGARGTDRPRDDRQLRVGVQDRGEFPGGAALPGRSLTWVISKMVTAAPRHR